MNDHMMQAMTVDAAGGAFRMTSMAVPAPRPGEVLVRIAASAVNPLDTKIRAGAAEHARHPLPAVLGIDMAGTVEAIGTGVDRFRPGDAVYGMTGGVGGIQGSLARFAAVDADLLAMKPTTSTMRVAASLPLAVITAWEGLIDRGRVADGMRVLIQGGAGGVGHVAVQLALARGARVSATGRAAQAETIEALGATFVDAAVDSGDDAFDLVFDTVGGAVLDRSFRLIRRFGHVVSCLGWGTHSLAPLSFRGGSYSGVFTLLPLLTGEGRARHGEILAEAAALVDAGKLLPRLDPRSFALADADAAHRAIADGTALGKIVVDID